jgi:hypothetical protein
MNSFRYSACAVCETHFCVLSPSCGSERDGKQTNDPKFMKSIVGWATVSVWLSTSQCCYSSRSKNSRESTTLCIPNGGGGGEGEILRSNQTHIVWRQPQRCFENEADEHEDNEELSQEDLLATTASRLDPRRSKRRTTTTAMNGGGYLIVQTIEDAKREAYQYLRDHVMSLDLQYLETLGFHDDGNDEDDDDDDSSLTDNNNNTAVVPPLITTPDGLANGLVQQVVNVSLQAKIDFVHADLLPRSIWQQYVLNYGHLNEGRVNVRRLLRDRLIEPLLLLGRSTTTNNEDNYTNHNRTTTSLSLADTVRLINRSMWRMLAPTGTDAIRFVAGQTPAIFDPASVLAFGYASCTGTSILFAEALRAAGIAARVAGTAAWNGQQENGNHNWVEVYDIEDGGNDNEAKWKFLEPSLGADDNRVVESIDDDPCSRWFCNAERMENGTMVYAAALEQRQRNNDTYFPLAWQWDCRAVPAVDRTDYYRSVCSSCGGDDRPAGAEEESSSSSSSWNI